MNKIVITLIYLLLSITIAEAAPITTKIDGFTYTLNTNNKTASLTKGDVNAVGSKTIPGEITYQSQTYTVTSIGSEAFKGAVALSWLTISENITSIGEGAFSGCTNLSQVSLPESLTEIGDNCFYNCKLLATINIPDNITYIGAGAFENCIAITSFKFPDGVKHVSDRVLFGCKGITSLQISPYTETIGVYSFRGCQMENITLPKTITSVGNYALFACTKVKTLTMGENVATIGDEALGGCTHLETLYIEGGNTIFGTEPFNAANFTGIIYVPDNRLGYYQGQSNLSRWKDCIQKMSTSGTTYEQNNLIYIVDDATNLTAKLVGYNAASGNITIPEYVMINSKKHTITSIGAFALANSGITSITCKEYIKSIADNAFAECVNLESVTLTNNIVSMGIGVFEGCKKLKTVTLPSNITTIPTSLCKGCEALTSITFTGTITEIGDDAMNGCKELTGPLTFSASLESIGDNAFNGCSKLSKITIEALNTTLGTGAFDGMATNFEIYVPLSRWKAYCVAQNWNVYEEHIKAEGMSEEKHLVDGLYYSIIDINAHTADFVGYETIGEELVIPYEVTIDGEDYSVVYIDANAFQGATSLTKIVIPETVSSIHPLAFNGLPSATKIWVYESKYAEYQADPNWAPYLSRIIVIPSITGFTKNGIVYTVTGDDNREVHISGYESTMDANLVLPTTVTNEDKTYTLTGIDKYAFKNCTKLTTITLTNKIITIGEGAFEGCTSLKSFELPTSVTAISNNMLKGCTTLANVTLHNQLTSIGEYSFANCTKIARMELPESLQTINKGAFAGCSKLENINIPESITKIPDYTFNNCHVLDSITFPPNLTEIGSHAFYSCKRIKVVDIPKTVKKIGEKAFYECESLNLIVLYSEYCTLGQSGFSSIASAYKIYVPESRLAEYKIAQNWSIYANNMRPLKNDGKSFLLNGIFYRITDFDNLLVQIFGYESTTPEIIIPDTVTFNDKKYAVTSLADKCFANCTMITKVKLPETVGYIGKSAFENCKKLTTINIPEKLTAIHEFTFGNCVKLKTLKLPESVTQIEQYAFANCDALTTINLTQNLEAINKGIFQGCHHLLTIEIPPQIESIAPYAFTDCSYMTDITLPDNIKSIGTAAFANNRTLEYIEFPSTLTTIGDSAFYGCWILKQAIVKGENTQLGVKSFDKCDKITTIYVPISAIDKYKNDENWGLYKDIIQPLYLVDITTDFGCTTNQRHDVLLDSTIIFTVKKDFELKVYVNGQDVSDQLVQDGNTYSLKIIDLEHTSSIKATTSIAIDKSGYYEIATKDQLYWFIEHVSQTANQKAKGKLTADIVCNTNVVARVHDNKTAELEQWYPNCYTGKYRTLNRNTVYEGTFEGNGHTISGIYINDTTLANAGLFQTLKGTVKNLAITDSYIIGQSNCGIVCGNNQGTISNCYVQGGAKGKNNIGGLAGSNLKNSKITNCLFEGEASGDENIGTIAGKNSGTISSVLTYGYSSGDSKVGTICGVNNGSLKNCRFFTEFTKLGAVAGSNFPDNLVSPTNYLEGASTDFASNFDDKYWTPGNTQTVSTMAELTLPCLSTFEELSKKSFVVEIKIDGFKKAYFTGNTLQNNGYIIMTYGVGKKDTFNLSASNVTLIEPDMETAGKATVNGKIYDLDFSYTIQLILNPTPVSTVDANGVKVWGYGKTLYVENAEGRKIRIYDLSGRLIKTIDCNTSHFCTSLKSGIYVIHIGGSKWKISL